MCRPTYPVGMDFFPFILFACKALLGFLVHYTIVPFKWAWLAGIFFSFFSFCMESPVWILVPVHNGSIYEGMLGRNLEKIKGAKTKHTHTHTIFLKITISVSKYKLLVWFETDATKLPRQLHTHTE